MVLSYDNMSLGIYMNNIVRFFKDDKVKIKLNIIYCIITVLPV